MMFYDEKNKRMVEFKSDLDFGIGEISALKNSKTKKKLDYELFQCEDYETLEKEMTPL